MKCQSKRSASFAGAAWKSGEGELANSAASRTVVVSLLSMSSMEGEMELTDALYGRGFRIDS